MTRYEQVKVLVLKGLWPAEIREALRGTSDRTVQQYCHRILRDLTVEEREAVDQLRAKRPKPPSGLKQFFERKTVSPLHVLLGSKLYYFRSCLEMSTGQFADHFQFSNRIQISTMEQGYHDFTLMEIIRLAKIMEFTPIQLMEMITNDLPSQ